MQIFVDGGAFDLKDDIELCQADREDLIECIQESNKLIQNCIDLVKKGLAVPKLNGTAVHSQDYTDDMELRIAFNSEAITVLRGRQ